MKYILRNSAIIKAHIKIHRYNTAYIEKYSYKLYMCWTQSLMLERKKLSNINDVRKKKK